MDLESAKQTFIVESQELLDAMEEALLAMEGTSDRTESVNAMFRAIHTIKGSAGLFGLDTVVRFSHTVETVLDRTREQPSRLTPELTGIMLGCHDHIASLIAHITQGSAEPPELLAAGVALLDQLVPYLEPPRPATPHLPATVSPGAEPEDAGRGAWHISLRFGPDVLRMGMDPLSFLRYLRTLGKITHLVSLLNTLPTGAAFDPETCYLGLELALESEAGRQTIEDVFEFVRQDCHIRIFPPQAKVEEYLAFIQEMGGSSDLLGEILVKSGALTERELQQALAAQSQERQDTAGRKLGDMLVANRTVPTPVVEAALERQRKAPGVIPESKTIKVQAEKLDRLVDLVGELVIAGATAHVLASQVQGVPVSEATATINKLVEAIRDNALSLRMVQIGDTFNRFRRVVRDVGQELGKNIRLEIRGGETELDKSIVEKLNDPLMHIVRNAMDHGIESRDVRLARGKPEEGSISLFASHESGSIVIEISDDGGGLNREKILAKATERGLIKEGVELSEQEVLQLIFAPGFSTADAVTNLSGRGVGMDVVRRNIDELRGNIEVETYEGAGTTLRIRLPLTLAIIDGFRVGVGNASYVLPLDLIQECMDLSTLKEGAGSGFLNLRGEVLPCLRLREAFAIPGDFPDREQVVVIQYGENRIGLVVERLYGELQTVIKPLGALFQHIRGVGGSTILGSGEVAMLLDIPQIVQIAATRANRLHANA